jgi:hypothetical protein
MPVLGCRGGIVRVEQLPCVAWARSGRRGFRLGARYPREASWRLCTERAAADRLPPWSRRCCPDLPWLGRGASDLASSVRVDS